MKTIQKFKSFCGKIFDTAEECIKYEIISKQVNEFLSTIEDSEKYDEGCSFSNGKGYIQHPKDTKNKIEQKLIELSNQWFTKWAEEKPFTNFNYVLGRLIDDTNMSCLNKLSYKLMCIDEQGREFGQPYYCSHPEVAELRKLN